MKAIDIIKVTGDNVKVSIEMKAFGLRFITEKYAEPFIEAYDKGEDKELRAFLEKEVKAVYAHDNNLYLILK